MATTPYKSRRSLSSTQSGSAAMSDQLIGQFRKLSHIGKGSFAEVFRGIHVEKRATVAIKSVNMNKLNKKLKDNLVSEITILRSLHHPHIVALIDCQETPSRMHIIMEFCELGDLSAFIKKRADLRNHPETQRMMEKYPNPAVGGLNEVVVRHFAKQIASALEFLRSKNYIHRDLKPQNLLLNPASTYYSKSGTIQRMPLAADEHSLIPATGIESLPMLKIADFGFARILPTTSLAETLCGSPLYMAPEILRYEKYDAKADLWSVGTVLYEMVCGRPPFRANNHVELLRKIEDRKDQIGFLEGVVISRPMKSLIRALLKRVPVERMSYDDFFNDPVIQGEIPGLVDEDRPRSSEPEPALTKRAQKVSGDTDQWPQEIPYSQSPRERSPYGITPPPRSDSRPVSGHYGTPPRPSSVRRPSGTALPTHDQIPSQRERRPPLTNAVTAPVRPHTLQHRGSAPSAGSMGRRYSREEPSPGSSILKEHFDRERIPPRAEDRAAREAKERADQDIAFERDYVLVEKRRVEIDALADEFAANPNTTKQKAMTREGAMVRRATTQGSPTSTTGATVPSKAIQIASRNSKAPAHQRHGSYERRYRPSFESATSALTKAMNMVSIRGLGISPPLGKGVSPPKGYSPYPTYPTAQSSLLFVGDGLVSHSTDEDAVLTKNVEHLAHISNAVYGFADIKYRQLVPVTPSGLGINRTEERSGETDEEDDLTPDATLTIAEESLVLTIPTSGSPRSADHTNRMNMVVQWIRNRFNECCDKSEFVARKLQEAQKQLPEDHPSHPRNLSSDSGFATTIGSTENIHLTTGVTAEKLMYDRALEMSRTAAVSELVNEDLPACELNYYTAILMVEAILEEDEDGSKGKFDGEEINGLEKEDRQSLLKLLESMRARYKALKKKIEIQKAEQNTAKRASISSTPIPQPSSLPRGSPSSQGIPK
ncbi:Serine/threonine-protein kinase atg1 [Delitschia confertaspora ATCC 74209]|uniref:non-specific serine/threonine protein kinase n=1 Tax=Delitschia confertaspora ATCC 74209 TaxID=1513339 RepID=A0A9P4JC47_9PLEO|nr:Serine/threonine-protein kinase atg1 [Delitschia confertaspora ATCC 74209]